jgi:spore coat protein A, manganese oxidase
MRLVHLRPRPAPTRGRLRLWLVAGLLVGAALLLAGALAQDAGAAPVRITQFAEPLPIPAVAQPTSIEGDGTPVYTITMTQFLQKMAANLPPTWMWGYDGYTPGPVIVAPRGQQIKVNWVNDLPTTHLLPIDHSLMGAGIDVPDVRAVVHVHGAHVPPAADGLPEDWFTPGHSVTITYPNAQRAADLIFHDHALGATRLNVYAGLIGAWLIVDPAQDALDLPSGQYDVPLIVQDKTFYRDSSSPDFGRLAYPAGWVPEYFGDTILVNGMAWPYMKVEARKYRFRIYGGGNDRYFNFRFSNDMSFKVIGTDGGLLAHPARVRHLLLGPGQRADVVVDFAKAEGRRILLTNDARTPYPDGDPVGPRTTGRVMQFRVADQDVNDPSRVPATLATDVPTAASLVAQSVKTRDITLSEVDDVVHPDPAGGFYPMPLLEGLHYDDPVTITPKLGTTEVWRYINTTGDLHPIHQHDVMNRIVKRIPFDGEQYEADLQAGVLKPFRHYVMGPAQPARPWEDGWKDTVNCPPNFVTVVVMTFTDFTGAYVLHCHILAHEEHDMMRPFEVLP